MLRNISESLQRRLLLVHYVLLFILETSLKPGFHYPSWRPSQLGYGNAPVNMALVDG